jgi:hypothetical protein
MRGPKGPAAPLPIATEPSYDLDELLSRVTEDNRHEEFPTGSEFPDEDEPGEH